MTVRNRLIDERFWAFRQRSTSLAGIISAVLAVVLFEYRLLVNHVVRWDLLSIGMTFVVVKLAVMGWSYFNN
ncbi:MAG TPA: hypothetical protein VMU28_05665 [Terriglobales bacterium]|nr:hypothetical protein [Terriglobales bacterium]